MRPSSTCTGCKIKALRAKTNTYIKTPVRGEEPVFVVTGRKEDVAAAKKEILSAAEHFSQIRAQRKGGGSPTTGVGLPPGPPHMPGQITRPVRVPYKVVGLVVGPKGATIKRIQNNTKTYIVTPSRDREPVFEVTGLPEDVELARKEIENHITFRTGGMPDNDFSPLASPLTPSSSSSSTSSSSSGHHQHMKLSSTLLMSYGNSLDSSFAPTDPNSSCSSSSSSGGSSSFLDGGSGYFNNHHHQHHHHNNHNQHQSHLPNQLHQQLQNGGGCSNSSSSSSSSYLFSDDTNGIWSSDVDSGHGSSIAGNAAKNTGWGLYHSNQSRAGLGGGFGGGGRGGGGGNGLRAVIAGGPARGASPPGSAGGDSILHPAARRFHSEPLGSTGSGVGGGLLELSSCSSSGATDSSGGSPSPPLSAGTLSTKRSICVVCFDSPVLAALVPCGHNLFCMECAQRISGEGKQCPVCEQNAHQAIRIISRT
ncbi:unnamed protein product [Notodromas monacha]|uniref:RING-type domain-containing protein n=1 Tax=Notodromas monacha TaxID=399045 RepID=A0A7R9BNB3_9CRUS|nr:unnamed protein product [Notodromas monacha]CAG0918348.1 unnamed protein product [Notodromas monacha]